MFAVFIESFTGQKSEKQSVVPSQSAENWRILKGNKPHAYVGELGRPFKDLFWFFGIQRKSTGHYRERAPPKRMLTRQERDPV